MTDPRDTEGDRRDHMMLGVIVENVDPEGLGRCKVNVQGILEPQSRWAFPIGRMLGVQNGVHWVPEKGTNVCVWLNQGDQDEPYFAPGPPGKPGGQSDVPDQAPAGSVDHMVVRWRDFVITFNGKTGEERVTFEDLTSGTKLDIERSTGDFLRDVEGKETINVKGSRDVTVEEGDETHTVTAGKRTTSVKGDDSTTVVSGNKLDTISAGNEVKNIPAGGSTETMAAGAKTITALTLALTATAAAALTAGGALTLTAGGALLLTTPTGIVTLVGTQVLLGPAPALKIPIEALFALWTNLHTHPITSGSSAGVTGPPVQKILPGGTAPDVDTAAVTSATLLVSP